VKAFLVGRHKLLEAQSRGLEELGFEIVGQVVNIDDPVEFINSVVQKGAEAVVIQALPLSLLAQILPLAKRNNIKIFMFEQGRAQIFNDEEEARKFVEEAPDRRILLISATDQRFRVVEFTGVVEVKEIKVVTVKVWEP